jgi:hypothetical protein
MVNAPLDFSPHKAQTVPQEINDCYMQCVAIVAQQWGRTASLAELSLVAALLPLVCSAIIAKE